jgi:hypothetical protein
MPLKLNIDIEKLLRITIETINEKKIQCFNDIPQTKKVNDYFWSTVCIKYYGSYNKNQCFSLIDWFCRNTSSYSERIKNFFENDNLMETDDSLNYIKLVFKFEEWKTFLKYINHDRFQNKFFEILNQRTQKCGIKCFLNPINNWFNKKNKQNTNHWNAKLRCRNKECKLVYTAYIKSIEPDKNVEVILEWSGNCSHPIDNNIKRTTGKKRRELGLELIARGNTNVKNDIFLSNEITDSKS